MKLYKCEMCGKKYKRIYDHHVIPWYLSHDDSEINVMRLCESCHRKADANFVSLIMYGEMNVGKRVNKRAHRRYIKKYVVLKMLHADKLLKNTYYQDWIYYNMKTGRISIFYRWRYIKRRPSIGSIINIHRRAKNAAAVKGQATLDGRF